MLFLLGTQLFAGCGYRIAAPPQLGEALIISVSANKSRLVRSQAVLQQEVGRVIQQRLAWDISPDGTSRLDLQIDREVISVAARTTDDGPSRWKIVLKATATIHAAHRDPETRSRSFTGVGYANGRLDEPEGLASAANSLAAAITDWLEHSTGDWPFKEGFAEDIPGE